jgi:hypothetical protein
MAATVLHRSGRILKYSGKTKQVKDSTILVRSSITYSVGLFRRSVLESILNSKYTQRHFNL